MRLGHGLLLVLVLVCGVSLWYGLRGDGSSAEGRPSVTAAAPLAAGSRETAEPSVLLAVLNGVGVSQLAGDVAMLVGRVGCMPGRIENAPHSGYRRSLLVNRRLDDDRARDLARSLGGVPVLREADPRAAEDAVLVLGLDYARICAALGMSEAADGSE